MDKLSLHGSANASTATVGQILLVGIQLPLTHILVTAGASVNWLFHSLVWLGDESSGVTVSMTPFRDLMLS